MRLAMMTMSLLVVIAAVVAVMLWPRDDGIAVTNISPDDGAGLPDASPPPTAHDEPEEPAVIEKRFTIVFRPRGNDDTVGSISMLAGDRPGYVLLSTERPGDAMMFSMGGLMGGGGGGAKIGTAEGSEIRFAGSVETDNGRVVASKDGRLAFRKINGDWAYVSGVGRYEEGDFVTELGKERTVRSCLKLLRSEDPILREGGARDLGRLYRPPGDGQVVSQLSELLNDDSLVVRRGAVEGLGLVGTVEAEAILHELYASSPDSALKEFVAEALTFCAAYTLLGEAESAKKANEVGLGYLKQLGSGQSGPSWLGSWLTMNLRERIAGHRDAALEALRRHQHSSDSEFASAARSLLATLFPEIQLEPPEPRPASPDSEPQTGMPNIPRPDGSLGDGVGPAPRDASRPVNGDRDQVSSDLKVVAAPVVPGSEFIIDGVSVATVAPRISPVMRMTAHPTRQPVIQVTFDQSGQATRVTFLQKTGSDALDAAILQSVYQWKAHGEAFDLAVANESGIVIRVTLNILPATDTQPAAIPNSKPDEPEKADVHVESPGEKLDKNTVTVFGTLRASTLYNGDRLPLLYRLMGNGGRTVAYVSVDGVSHVQEYLGRLVTIEGTRQYSKGLRLNIVTPTRVTLLSADDQNEGG